MPTLGPAMPIGIDYTLFYATADIARRAPIRAFVRWLHEMVVVSSGDFDRWIDEAALRTERMERPSLLQR